MRSSTSIAQQGSIMVRRGRRIDELGRVLGMTPAILTAIRPHLTLFGPAQPSAASPDAVVAAALAEALQVESIPSLASRPRMC
jgi:hypothetical protein